MLPIVFHIPGLQSGQLEGVSILLQIAPETLQIRSIILDGIGTATLAGQRLQKIALQLIKIQ